VKAFKQFTGINALFDAVKHCLLYIIPVQANSLGSMKPDESQIKYHICCSHFVKLGAGLSLVSYPAPTSANMADAAEGRVWGLCA